MWIGILGIFGLFALVCGPVIFVASDDMSHQPDQQMIANFNVHESEFNALLSMIESDQGLHRVDENWTEPADPITVGIAASRIAKYRELFKRLGIPRGFSAYREQGEIELIASSQGFVTHGSSKSYVFTKQSPHPELLVNDLDKFDRVGHGYRKIKGNWYLKYYGD